MSTGPATLRGAHPYKAPKSPRTVHLVSTVRTLDRARCGVRAHPLALDASIAAGVLACMVAGSLVVPRGAHGVTWGIRTPDPLSLLLMLLAAATLVFRRRAPKTVLAVTGALSAVECVTGDPRAPVAMSAVSPCTPSPRPPTAPPAGASACSP